MKGLGTRGRDPERGTSHPGYASGTGGFRRKTWGCFFKMFLRILEYVNALEYVRAGGRAAQNRGSRWGGWRCTGPPENTGYCTNSGVLFGGTHEHVMMPAAGRGPLR